MTTRQVLCADDGMLLTDGETFCRAVYLAVGEDAGAWTEMNSDLASSSSIST